MPNISKVITEHNILMSSHIMKEKPRRNNSNKEWCISEKLNCQLVWAGFGFGFGFWALCNCNNIRTSIFWVLSLH